MVKASMRMKQRRPDGSQVLVDAEVLAPDSGALISLALSSPSPVERDSMLLLDPDLNASGKYCNHTLQWY